MISSISNVKLTEKVRSNNDRMVAEYEAKHGPTKLSAIEVRDHTNTPVTYETTQKRIDRLNKEKDKK